MEIQTFEYNFDEIRTVEDDKGNICFVAKDICNILELSNITETLRSLDDDELSSVVLKSGGQSREMKLVNESGLYSLIFKSRKPEAKKFKRWVTHDVLPSIRKTGSYNSHPKNKKRSLSKMASDFEAFKKMAVAAGLHGNQAVFYANNAMVRHYGENPLELIKFDLQENAIAIAENDYDSDYFDDWHVPL